MFPAAWSALFVSLVVPASALQDWRIEGDQAGARLGTSLATADFNGDGYGDLVVGAPGYDDAYSDEGRATLYLGSPAGISAAPAWTKYGRQRGARFGSRVAAAGDVNGDGFEDVLVTAPDYDDRGNPANPAFVGALERHERYATDEGRVQLFLGSPSGLSNLPQRTLTGIQRGEHVGAALAGAGDVNGDGFDDVLIAASGTDGGRGILLLFLGAASGMPATPAWTRLGETAGLDWTSAVAAAGDVNQDGFADFVSSALLADLSGRIELFLGSAVGPGADPDQSSTQLAREFGPSGDFDQDGFPETLFLGSPQASWVSFAQDSGGVLPTLPAFSPSSAVAAGDVNGDGGTDLIASSSAFHNGALRGRVFVYLNRPEATFSPSGAFPVFDGDQVGADWGAALATTDVDGDGADELFIAAPGQDAGQSDEGIVSLFSGWSAGWSLTETSNSPIAGPPAGVVVDTAVGDLDGDGFSDLLVSRLVNNEELPGVYYGSASGLPASADATLSAPTLPAHYALTVNSLSTGDANGDAYPDALVTYEALNFSGNAALHALYLGSSAGLSASPLLTLEAGTVEWFSAFAGDVNGDGSDDVIDGSNHLFLGSSSGLETIPAQTLPGVPLAINPYDPRSRSILPGDTDGDGYGDVLLTRQGPAALRLEHYSGSPGGLVLQQVLVEPDAERSLALQDVDGDGLDELLVEVETNQCRVYRLSPAGFTRTGPWWEPALPAGIYSLLNNRVLALFDADQDGFNDLLLEGQHLHRGSAAGIARIPSWIGSADIPLQELRPGADFDGDGRVELLSVSRPFNVLRVFEVAP